MFDACVVLCLDFWLPGWFVCVFVLFLLVVVCFCFTAGLFGFGLLDLMIALLIVDVLIVLRRSVLPQFSICFWCDLLVVVCASCVVVFAGCLLFI